MTKIIFSIVIVVLVGSLTISYFLPNSDWPEGEKVKEKVEGRPITAEQSEKTFEVIAENLQIPWELAFLPTLEAPVPANSNQEILLTERPGSLLLIKNKQKIPIKGVEPVGEGGLLGLALHSDFIHNRLIYLYLTTKSEGRLANRVESYRLQGNQLLDRRIIVQGIAAAANHDGGRIAFGPDGNLYITTGDAQNPESAQDKDSLNGKILRIEDDGTIPADNPFGNAVYSYGHRNPQGIAWDGEGRLWATEHGRSGVLSGLDELNLIEKGKNYGWPVIQGEEKQAGMISPVIQSGPKITWAPAGATFYDGHIFFGGLRGEALFEYKIADKTLRSYFRNQFGRIRAVVLGPDNYLYITTSNTDGRGTPREGDDKLIRLNPKNLR